MNLDPFLTASPVLVIHILSAFFALGLGLMMWVRRKGTKSHKFFGRIFASLMGITAFTAIFIRELNNGNFSWIHLFVPLTFYTLWEIFRYIRQGDIKKHQRSVTGLFFGALLIPSLFSFLPGRLMWVVFFGGS